MQGRTFPAAGTAFAKVPGVELALGVLGWGDAWAVIPHLGSLSTFWSRQPWIQKALSGRMWRAWSQEALRRRGREVPDAAQSSPAWPAPRHSWPPEGAVGQQAREASASGCACGLPANGPEQVWHSSCLYVAVWTSV